MGRSIKKWGLKEWAIAASMILAAIYVYGYVFRLPLFNMLFTKPDRTTSESQTRSRTASASEHRCRVVSVDTKVTERNNYWWRFSWIVKVRNDGAESVQLWSKVKFMDNEGFAIDYNRFYDWIIPARSTKTFTGFKLIKTPTSSTIKKTLVEIEKAGWSGTGEETSEAESYLEQHPQKSRPPMTVNPRVAKPEEMVRWGVSEYRRKLIYKSIIQIERRASDEAYKAFPTDAYQQADEDERLYEKYMNELSRNSGISREVLRNITAEGAASGWTR